PQGPFGLVAVTGPDLPASRGGPPGRGVAVGTPAPPAWILYDTPSTNARGERTGQGFSTAGTWPPGFDTLPDRCHFRVRMRRPRVRRVTRTVVVVLLLVVVVGTVRPEPPLP